MNLSEIRDLIRAEANIEGLDEYQTLIDNLINQELQRLTGLAPYAELLTEATLTWTVDGQFDFDLPTDFQLLNRIIYVPNPTNTASAAYGNPFPLDKGFSQGFQTCPNGVPQFYHRFGTKLRIYPYLSSYTGDSLTLSYYKKPELVLDGDLFPVDSLIPPVQQFVMARMLRMTNTQKARDTQANANQALIAARAQNAGS